MVGCVPRDLSVRDCAAARRILPLSNSKWGFRLVSAKGMRGGGGFDGRDQATGFGGFVEKLLSPWRNPTHHVLSGGAIDLHDYACSTYVFLT